MKKVILIVLALLMTTPVWAKNDHDCQPLDVYVRSAKIYLQQRIPDFNSAQKQLDKALECYPDAPEPRYILSKVYYRKMMFDEFLSLAQSMDTLDTEKKFIDSVWMMRRAAWGDLFNMGVDSLKSSNRLDSLRAVAQNEGDHERYDSLTNVGRKFLEAAKDLFLFAMRMDSTRSEPWQNLGVIDVRLQNWEDALTEYRNALAAKPGDVDLVRNLMSLNLRLERSDSAMHYVNVLLESNPDDLEALTNKAAIYANMGFPDSANMVFEEIINKDPNNKPVLFNLGMTQLQSAQEYAAQEKRYTKDANKYADEYNKLAGENASKKKLDAARQRQKDAVTSLQEAMANRKEAWGKASGMFERLAELDSTDTEALYYWGLSQFYQDHYDSALVPLEQAIRLDSTNCQAWKVLSYTYSRLSMADKAEEARAALESNGCN